MLKLDCRDEDDFQNYFFGNHVDRDKIYKNIVCSIEMAHNSHQDVAHFAEVTFIYGDVIVLDAHRDQWIDNLTCAIKYYESDGIEDFERCQMIVKLIDKIQKDYE